MFLVADLEEYQHIDQVTPYHPAKAAIPSKRGAENALKNMQTILTKIINLQQTAAGLPDHPLTRHLLENLLLTRTDIGTVQAIKSCNHTNRSIVDAVRNSVLLAKNKRADTIESIAAKIAVCPVDELIRQDIEPNITKDEKKTERMVFQDAEQIITLDHVDFSIQKPQAYQLVKFLWSRQGIHTSNDDIRNTIRGLRATNAISELKKHCLPKKIRDCVKGGTRSGQRLLLPKK
jgi:hypothetical protein